MALQILLSIWSTYKEYIEWTWSTWFILKIIKKCNAQRIFQVIVMEEKIPNLTLIVVCFHSFFCKEHLDEFPKSAISHCFCSQCLYFEVTIAACMWYKGTSMEIQKLLLNVQLNYRAFLFYIKGWKGVLCNKVHKI